MNRRKFLQSTTTLGVALLARPYVARAAAKEILVAEPVHSTGYLPLYIAIAKAKGADLRAVAHCVDRGNVYFCAAKGYEPTSTDWPGYFKGKAVAIGPFGGTPNSITRYLLK